MMTIENSTALVETISYFALLNLRKATYPTGLHQVTSEYGVLAQEMQYNIIVEAVTLGVMQDPFTKAEKDQMMLTLKYGTWVLAVKDDLVSKAKAGEDIQDRAYHFRDVANDLVNTTPSDAALKQLYLDFGLTAP